MKLSYPRELTDLGFIVPKGVEGDQVLEVLKLRLKEVQGKSSVPGGKFNLVTILRQDVEVPMSQDEKGHTHGDDGSNYRPTCTCPSKSSTVDLISCEEFPFVDHVGTPYFMGVVA